MTKPRPFQGWFVVHRLGLATVNLYTKYEVSMFTHYEDITRNSAMAEGPRDAFVSIEKLAIDERLTQGHRQSCHSIAHI